MIETILISVCSGVAIAGLSSWITVQLSVNQFRSEKWWERKVEAYERVIEALHHIKAVEKIELSYEGQNREIPEDRDKELNERVKPAYQEVHKAYDVGAFLLSTAASKRIVQYFEERDEAWRMHAGYISLDHMVQAAETCLRDLIAAARKDLGQRERMPKLWDMR